MRFSLARRGNAGVAVLLLLSFAVCFSGLPVYRLPHKNLSRPFPCQDNPCGCADAETCWRDCCCNTHAQKLAWAKANNVTPPAYVFELAKAERAQPKACCKKTAAASCCKAKGRGGCCTKPTATEKKSPHGNWVTWIGRQKCRGLAPSFLALGHSIPLGARVVISAPQRTREIVRTIDVSPRVVFFDLDAPPPRVALA